MRPVTPYVITILAPLAGLVVVAWAGTAAPPAQRTVSAEQATEVRRAITRWLECEECTEGELEAVVESGDLSVPALAATLRGGAAPATRETVRLHLIATYAELQRYARTHPEAAMSLTEEEYVATYLENHEALYRIRAAMALAAIGGPVARAGLQEASAASLRPDVQAAVQDGLDKVR